MQLPDYKLSEHQAKDAAHLADKAAEARELVTKRMKRETLGSRSSTTRQAKSNSFGRSDENTDVGFGVLEAGEERRQHTFVGHAWAVRDTAGKLLLEAVGRAEAIKVEVDGKAAPSRPHRERERPGRARPATTSRQTKNRARAFQFNVVLHNVESGEEHHLTSDGNAANAYNGRFYWSPDSKHLITLVRSLATTAR